MSSEPRHAQVPVGPLVASVGGLVLIVSLFLDWYDGLSGFRVFEFNDLLLLLLGLAAIVALAGAVGLVTAVVSPGMLLAIALLALFVVASQVVNDPPAVPRPGPGHAIGIWVALAASLLMVVGAVLGYAQISLAVEARPRGGGVAKSEAPAVADREPPAADTSEQP